MIQLSCQVLGMYFVVFFASPRANDLELCSYSRNIQFDTNNSQNMLITRREMLLIISCLHAIIVDRNSMTRNFFKFIWLSLFFNHKIHTDEDKFKFF